MDRSCGKYGREICVRVLVGKSERKWSFLRGPDEDIIKMDLKNTVIPRLTKIIRSGMTFVSRNVISRRFL